MKTFAKRAAYCLAFVLGLAGLLLLASYILMPKTNQEDGGIQDPGANGILSEAENTIDVLVLGDSETYSSIIPLEIWQKYGITAYVCGTSAQKLCYSQEFLEKAFERQQPKVVILETNAIFRAFTRDDVLSQKADSLFPVFRYHNRWKTLSAKDFHFAVNYTYVENSKGYVFTTVASPAANQEYMTASDERETIPEKNPGYVQQILSYCQAHGAELILLSTPSAKNWNSKRHNSIQDLATSLGVVYVDMNLLPQQIPINWQTDTRDEGDHLNYFGAVKVSDYLGQYMADMKIFSDKRQDQQYDSWNAAWKAFYEMLQKAKIA